ncbi:phosphoglucomutase (alpha-D-glucose-1,6-bisphosphate-dependent) [Salidesulfovibrio onnuriiensis]|uniref:phosphoglucomutase (alpha-D-glucose-1,6-bisphosphate-dependent) n=1 Tax=Salidesulfovibrio onnuriiensis TaxID=2583823 RepID=UPI0011CA815E|nr:phosphoglucomutase (alpha-D-glucose-1,6-bisphosphate-dependent) [Salidesulfovibrio onnuriiensis]
MALHELAGKLAPQRLLENIPRLVAAYYLTTPDPEDPAQGIAFGTSGHRGSSLNGSFNEPHILAVCQSICEYRKKNKITGPLFMGMDTHALSEPALATALEVFAANDVAVHIQQDRGYTPTPVISHAILTWNQNNTSLADGVVITPSHNPPKYGGFKYNPPQGGPADTSITQVIQDRANEILKKGTKGIKRIPFEKAIHADCVTHYDFVMPYVRDLRNILDMDAISAEGLRIGVDPMGGASIGFWDPIADTYELDLVLANHRIDPTFSFMTVDKDGKIRMDCSSRHAMASLIKHKDIYDIAFGNDPDADRHGIVTSSSSLLNPNHYLAVAADYLFRTRTGWGKDCAIGKTLVSSSMIDRVAKELGHPLFEVPVGFKWFANEMLAGRCTFGGEESAGASFARRDGSVWTTDKDGIIMDLLAAEITAQTGRDPGEHYQALVERHGSPVYERTDAPATNEQKAAFKVLTPDMITADSLAGERIEAILTNAPGNDAPIGGLKVTTKNGWFAARPSGTEEIYKIYAESFIGLAHLKTIQAQAQEIVNAAFKASGC